MPSTCRAEPSSRSSSWPGWKTVHRLEFEFGREALVEFDLNTPDQVLAAAGDLWAYATGDWLTYRSTQLRLRYGRARP
jgi:hypothetical protein